jgi:hypothetical protein
MSRAYRGYAVIMGEDSRYHACIAGWSMFSTHTVAELRAAIDRAYMSLPDARAALEKAAL